MKTIFNLNRPYVRNSGKFFAPFYVPGERYSNYINFDGIPPSDTDDPLLVIINSHAPYSIVAIIRTMFKVYVAGTVGYHLYLDNFVFPHIADGQYFFSLVHPGDTSSEFARSNIILVNSKCLDTTSYIEFRHDDQLFGVRYDLLPDFYQKFRLPINIIKAPEISSVRESYRQASGQRELRVSKSFRDIKQTLEMYWANQEDFEALSAMLEHSDVKINGSSLILLDQVKVENISDFSNQYKGTFTVIVKADEPANYMPEVIFRGGTNNYIYTTIIRGR